jgi:hypothetical protein
VRDVETRIVQQYRGQHAEPAAQHEDAVELAPDRVEQRVGEPQLARDLVLVERLGERRLVEVATTSSARRAGTRCAYRAPSPRGCLGRTRPCPSPASTFVLGWGPRSAQREGPADAGCAPRGLAPAC